LEVPENSKNIGSGVGVGVTTDPDSWTEILPEETRIFLIEVGPVQIHNIDFPDDQFSGNSSLSCYHKVVNNGGKYKDTKKVPFSVFVVNAFGQVSVI
jgi:hypothetical protein